MKYSSETISWKQYKNLSDYEWDNLYYCSTEENWHNMLLRFQQEQLAEIQNSMKLPNDII